MTTNPKVKVYQRDIIMLIRSMGLHREQIDSLALVDFKIFPKTKAKLDVSNYLKVYEDALQKSGFIVDDHWIEYEGVRKGDVDPKNPRIELVIRV